MKNSITVPIIFFLEKIRSYLLYDELDTFVLGIQRNLMLLNIKLIKNKDKIRIKLIKYILNV